MATSEGASVTSQQGLCKQDLTKLVSIRCSLKQFRVLVIQGNRNS